MTIWVLVVLIFCVTGLLGFTLGAVRTACSFVGVLAAWLLAAPLGHHLDALTKACGVTNPVMIWMVGPVIAFLLIRIAFGVIGVAVNQKVDVFYKYKARDLEIALWNRLNPRLGLCIGILDGVVMTILVSWALYFMSYATSQVTVDDNSTWTIKMVNSAGASMQSSGMNKIAASIDSIPEVYYQCADLAGLIYHNDLLEGRLSRYPAFIPLAESPEFQDMANDKEFAELRQKQAPIADILANSKAQTIVNNPDLLQKIYDTVVPNLSDLKTFLTNGVSEKYDSEKILGRWEFDPAATFIAAKQSKPNMTSVDSQRIRTVLSATLSKAKFIAAPEPGKEIWLKGIGKIAAVQKPKTPLAIENHDYHGTWDGDPAKYQLHLADKTPGTMDAMVDGDHLTLTGDTYPMVFKRQD